VFEFVAGTRSAFTVVVLCVDHASYGAAGAVADLLAKAGLDDAIVSRQEARVNNIAGLVVFIVLFLIVLILIRRNCQ
jgi:Na+/H+-dicarboxylate symporter